MKKIITIGELGTIITGNTPPRSNPELYGNYIPFIKATDISETEKFTYHHEEYYSEEGYNRYIKSLIPKGSTCVVTIGSIGKKMTMAHCDLFINQAMNAVIPNKNFDNEYVYYAVKNILPNIKMLDSGTASGRENVSKSAFSKMQILIEDNIITQRRIAEIFSRYDSLIENYQRQIKLLEEAVQRLYKEWFVDLRFPGYENTKIVDGVPEGWSLSCLSSIATDSGLKENKGNFIQYKYYLPIDCLPSKSIAYLEYKSLNLAESSLIGFHKNDILFGALRPYFHKVVVARHSGITRSTCFVLNAKEFKYWAYLVMLLCSKRTIDYATQNATGTTMPYIRLRDFMQMKILIPDSEILCKFTKKTEKVLHAIKVKAELVIKLTEARDRLLPKLMNGEIEV